MESLRVRAEAADEKNDELNDKVKQLTQENLSKEQEIKSLSYKNQQLEGELEKLEGTHKDLKSQHDGAMQHGTQNEALQRKMQILEEEAEAADKNIRETNDK